MKLAIINDYQRLARDTTDWSRLPENINVDIFHDRLTRGVAELLAPYEVVVAAREETQFDRSLIEQLPNLKLLITHGGRNAAFDMAALSDHGVVVCGTGYGFVNATVELAWGLILSLAKLIPEEDRGVRGGDWGLHLPSGLTGKTLGVLGLGRLGSGVARVAQAFDMNVIAWSENLTEAQCKGLDVTLVDKDALFTQSDVMSVHTILSERTRGIVGAREFALMKPTALFINTSRGPIVDETALLDALRRNVIAGAGLDVFDVEPLPNDHPLRNLPNTVLTPHIGGRTRENFAARYQDALENVLAWLDGAPLRVIQ
ncbi:MAG: D-2-hydroxyacid dehydrogenase family protein [Alphaproteobacteria bacterium]|nr:D-2-hydroxyacid dehydrogenase family protein [Alphaproteobacteria bacterium]